MYFIFSYREASDEVAAVFSEFCECVQRASIDEAYLDLSKAVDDYIAEHKENIDVRDLPSTYILGHCDLKTKDEGNFIKLLKFLPLNCM